MRAAVYLRISEDREGRELADCLTLAGSLGANVVEVYQDGDAPGFAGRPGYRRLLADAGAQRFGTVIAYTLGRLAEQPSEYEDLIELAQRHGIRFAYVRSVAADPATGAATSALIPIVGAVNTFRRLAGDLAPELKGLVADATPVIEPLAEGVAGFVRNAIPGVRGLVRESAPFLTEVSRALPPLGQAVGAFCSRVSPGAAGASVFVNDVIRLASAQAAFWGEVVGRLAEKYPTVRGPVTDAATAFATLPDRARRLVLDLVDQATTAVGVGIGSALGPNGSRSLPDLVGRHLRSTLDVTDRATSGLAAASAQHLGRARGTDSTVGFTTAVMERATGNILTGVKSGLSTPAPPAAVTVNGVNINVYGRWDPTDSAAVDQVVAGVYTALNRHRP